MFLATPDDAARVVAAATAAGLWAVAAEPATAPSTGGHCWMHDLGRPGGVVEVQQLKA